MSAVRLCTSKAAQIDTVLEQLKQHVLNLRNKGTLVKNTSEYKKQLMAENERLKREVEDLKQQLIDVETANGRKQFIAQPKKDTVTKETVNSASSKSSITTVAAQSAAPPVSSAKAEKKKAAKKQAKPTQQPKDAATPPADVSRLDMRVGFIRSAKLHPDADGLYLEEIDCGEAEPRQVISGLVKHIPIEQMQERPCVVLCNLKPAKMRGIMSHAMVMCASTPEKVEILCPPSGSKPGDKVTVEGFPGTPDQQLNPKKKVFEAIQPDFLVSPEGNALYKGVEWKINGQCVTSPSMRGCGIK